MKKELPDSINKRMLWRCVNQKLKYSIHHAHVFSVMNILFEEMLKDFVEGKSIEIYNFGDFIIKELKPRRFFNVSTRKIDQSYGYTILRFKLVRKIKKKLCKFLDFDTTIQDD